MTFYFIEIKNKKNKIESPKQATALFFIVLLPFSLLQLVPLSSFTFFFFESVQRDSNKIKEKKKKFDTLVATSCPVFVKKKKKKRLVLI